MNRLQAENNGNSHSPNIINVDVDSSSDLARHQSSASLTAKLKLNDLTDAIIAKDPSFGIHNQQAAAAAAAAAAVANAPYHHLTSGGHFVRTHAYGNSGSIPSKTPPTQTPPSSVLQPMGQEQIIATNQWNLNRRLQQQQQQQQKEEMAKNAPQGRSTPDDRHVIRMSQSPSPRTKMAPYEPVSPPETSSVYHQKVALNYDQRGGMAGAQEKAPGNDNSKILSMLHQRIAEAMRNEDHVEGGAGGGKDRRDGYERPRSGNNSAGPGNGVEGDEKSPAGKRESPQVYLSRPSSQPGNPQYQPSPSMPFMYPYNALTIPQPTGAIISPKPTNAVSGGGGEIIDSNRHMETTRQVMSDNYDALSDDEN